MAKKIKSGSVTSKSGKVTARNIITGIDIQGAASDEVIKAALAAMQHLKSGRVSGATGVEAGEDIITGLRYLNPAEPTRESFAQELQRLREQLAAVVGKLETPAGAATALESVDDTIAEMERETPRRRRIIQYLKETVSFIGTAGKALEAAHKAGPLIYTAGLTAAALLRAAGILF